MASHPFNLDCLAFSNLGYPYCSSSSHYCNVIHVKEQVIPLISHLIYVSLMSCASWSLSSLILLVLVYSLT